MFHVCRSQLLMPYMHSSASASPAVSSRPTFSCVRCADRKVKCDRLLPCSACVRHKAECIFRPPRPPRRRPKQTADQNIQSRLRHYEALLKDNGINPNTASQDESETTRTTSEYEAAHTPASSLKDNLDSVPKAQLLHDRERSKIVDK